MEKKDLTKKMLAGVARELNKVMDLDPPIKSDPKRTNAQIEVDLKEAAKELLSEDAISDESREILVLLDCKLPGPIAENSDEKGKPGNASIKKAKKEKDDKTGLTIGTKSHLFYTSIRKKAMTMADVKKLGWNENGATYFGTFAKLKKLGIMDKDEKGKICVLP